MLNPPTEKASRSLCSISSARAPVAMVSMRHTAAPEARMALSLFTVRDPPPRGRCPFREWLPRERPLYREAAECVKTERDSRAAYRPRTDAVKNERPAVSGGPPNDVPATSYSPTQLPTQYHRR